MRYSHVLGAAVVSLAATAAQAGLSVDIVPVVIDDSVRTSNPTLNGVRTYDLVVTTTAGTKWASADVQGSLKTTGAFTGTAFFNPAGGSDVEPASPGSAVLAYDTFVSSPRIATGNSSATSLLGKAQYPLESGTGPAVFPGAGTVVDAAWGDTSSGNVDALPGNGSYRVARFSVTGNGGGYVSGRVGATNNSVPPVTFSNLYIPILGDTNADTFVDQVDFDRWFENLNSVGTGFTKTGDIDLNGVVDQRDFDRWFENVNNSATPGPTLGSVVPEPASLGLLGLGLLLGARRRNA